MYHDEFKKWPTRKPTPPSDDLLPAIALEVGGGLSLGLAATLNQPLSIFLFYLGGLLPLVASSLSIAAHLASEQLARLAPSLEAARPSAVPVPHLSVASGRAVGHHFRSRQRSRSIQ